jgi:hypothetical protein
MKRINAYGGRGLFWNIGSGGWWYEFRAARTFQPPRRTAFTTDDGRPLFIFNAGTYGEGHAATLRDARRRVVRALASAV